MLPTATETHYRSEQRIAVATARTIRGLWGRMGLDFELSFRSLAPLMLEAFTVGQQRSVAEANAYVPAVLFETGQPDLPVADVQLSAFVGHAADGRPSQSLLYEAVIKAKTAVARGLPARIGLLHGRNFLDKAILSELGDAGRQVVAANIGARPSVTGYVRMLNPPSCPDCVLLAGKFYRWNAGFQRHKRCDCRHIPSSENLADDLRTDPYAYFASLSTEEQDAAFGRSEARAIRDGADIYRVMNTKNRGLGTVKARALYGTPTHRTVDDIYRTAGTRTNALRMMTKDGYITGPQVAGGNILGARYDGFGALGKGGSARAASDAVQQARLTGTRDPLNRYTMTAAERRIYDANWRLEYIARTGKYPNTVGPNSADSRTRPRRATAEQTALVRAELQKQLADLPNQPRSVSALAQRLGLLP